MIIILFLSADRTVLYFSFRFFFNVNDMILTQPEPKREWLRQQHHMGEVQTDFHPCDAVLSTGTQVKPLPFCFSTFLPFSLFLNENYLQTQQNNLNNLRSSAVSPKFKNLPGCWSWFAFCFFGFVFFFSVWLDLETQRWFLSGPFMSSEQTAGLSVNWTGLQETCTSIILFFPAGAAHGQRMCKTRIGSG